MKKPKIALHWCAACGGCEEAVIDSGVRFAPAWDRFDILFWPFAMDCRMDDLRGLGKGELAAAFISGAVMTPEQLETARLLRQKSRLVFALGACAHLGGVYGLANFFTRESILKRAYLDSPIVDNPEGLVPGESPGRDEASIPLTGLLENVLPLDLAIAVDYSIPGCPPVPASIEKAFLSLETRDFPGKGSVLAEKRALCGFCRRKDSFPEKLKIEKFTRFHETVCDPEICFLAQGVVCLGPSTRGGCESRCIDANMPCRGCFGPLDRVRDQGASSAAFLASMIETADPGLLEKIVASIPDIGGMFYRYGAAAGVLRRKMHWKNR